MAPNFDKVLKQVGQFGRYQQYVFVMTSVMAIPTGLQTVLVVLVGTKMPFRCVEDPLDMDNYTHANSSQNNWHSNCSYTEHCHIEFDTSVFTSTIRSQWQLVCDNDYMVAMVQTCYFAGWTLGVIITGYLSDRYGRFKVLFTCLALSCATNASAAYLTDYTAYLAFRFLSGVFTGSVFNPTIVVCVEMVGLKARAHTTIWMQFFFCVGFMVLAGVGYGIRDHQTLQLIVGLVPLVLMGLYWIFPESPRWLLSVNRIQEAEVIITKMARINRRHVDLKDPMFQEIMDQKSMNSQPSFSFVDLLKLPNLRRIMLALWFNWFVEAFVYYGIILSGASLGLDLFLNLLIVGLVEFPAILLASLFVERAGRIKVIAVCNLFGGIFCVACAFLIDVAHLNWLLVTLATLGKFAMSASFALIYLYTAELLPTVVRNAGIGSCSTVARIGGLLAPQVARLDHIWQLLPFLIFAITPLISGTMFFFMPETRGRTLSGTMSEGEELAKNFGMRKKKQPVEYETTEKNEVIT